MNPGAVSRAAHPPFGSISCLQTYSQLVIEARIFRTVIAHLPCGIPQKKYTG